MNRSASSKAQIKAPIRNQVIGAMTLEDLVETPTGNTSSLSSSDATQRPLHDSMSQTMFVGGGAGTLGDGDVTSQGGEGGISGLGSGSGGHTGHITTVGLGVVVIVGEGTVATGLGTALVGDGTGITGLGDGVGVGVFVAGEGALDGGLGTVLLGDGAAVAGLGTLLGEGTPA